nr:hypothetical protein [uncultured Campylobacter sp.]
MIKLIKELKQGLNMTNIINKISKNLKLARYKDALDYNGDN